MKESVRPALSKVWAIVRYGFGGLVLFALGGSTLHMLKSPECNLYAVKKLLGHMSASHRRWNPLMKVLIVCGIYSKPN